MPPAADVAALLTAYDEQARPAETTGLPPGIHAEVDGPIVRVVGERRGFVNGPVDLGVSGAELDALIGRQQDFFAARGEGLEWKTRAHDRPAELIGRLVAAGFVPEERETVLVCAAEQVAIEHPVLPAGVELREVTDDAGFRQVAELESEVWSEDKSYQAQRLAGEYATGSLVVLAAIAEGRMVCAAWSDFRPDTEFVGLWGGATLASWRGRGIYRALLARRAALAVRRGYRYLQIDASEDSRPIVERLGFTAVTTTTPYVWTPADVAG
ncbi:MAG TPA: GNAT family N-acetyltransferase [Pseudonocardiaceae bacterium]|jgi:GNAT superfamily N-acetyltransferase|nr:GNAT family N-acetyltransferase [Pseudonocardiaceae bacterium]